MPPSNIQFENDPAPLSEVANAEPDWTRVLPLLTTLRTMVTHIRDLVVIVQGDRQTRADWEANNDPTDPGVTMTYVRSTVDDTNGNFCIVFGCVSQEVRQHLTEVIKDAFQWGEPHTDEDSDHWELV